MNVPDLGQPLEAIGVNHAQGIDRTYGMLHEISNAIPNWAQYKA